MGNRVQTVTAAARRIEREFDEPLPDVLAGYAAMGHSIPLVAQTLEISPASLKSFCRRNEIHFPRRPLERLHTSAGRPPRLIRHRGRELSLTQWADELNVTPSTIHKRIRRTGAPDRN